MRCVTGFAVTALALLPSASGASPLDSFSQDQMTLLGRLGNAYATARNCNLVLDEDAIRRAAAPAFGEQAVPARQGLDVAWAINGFSALADSVIFAPPQTASARRALCAKMLKLYGPGGTVIDGALKP